MREMGFVGLWEKWFEPDVRPCLLKNKKNQRKKKQKKPLVRLTLTNLTGAFVLLGAGYIASLLVFVKEKIIFFTCCKRHADIPRAPHDTLTPT